jgi:hypothetical protein
MIRRVAVTLLLAGCAAPYTDVGTYEAVLPTAGGGDQHLRVTLHESGAAAVTSTFTDRISEFLLEGTWQREGNRITVKLDKQVMVFQRSGTLLRAKEWDRTVWGQKGPGVLERVNR